MHLRQVPPPLLLAHAAAVPCSYGSLSHSHTLAGKHLASSGDGGEVLLWEPVDAAGGGVARGNLCEDEGEATWRRAAALKGHTAQSDVMDLCWAPDGSALASGAIDNEVILFATAGKRRGDAAGRFRDHKHFVQGVAWDPAQQYVATQSADRTCRWGCEQFGGRQGAGRGMRRPWQPQAAQPCSRGGPAHAPTQGVHAQAAGGRQEEQRKPIPAARRRHGARPLLRPYPQQAGHGGRRRRRRGGQAAGAPAVCR